MQLGGKDATEEFDDVGHSDEAKEQLRELLIGALDSAVYNSSPLSSDVLEVFFSVISNASPSVLCHHDRPSIFENCTAARTEQHVDLRAHWYCWCGRIWSISISVCGLGMMEGSIAPLAFRALLSKLQCVGMLAKHEEKGCSLQAIKMERSDE